MLAVRLPEELDRRLTELARITNRSKSFYVREAISAHLDDMEDIYLAESVLDRIQRGEEEIVSPEEFWRGLEE
jgi:RHH-type rel operon transcriptional repressor/antitoxin RelB